MRLKVKLRQTCARWIRTCSRSPLPCSRLPTTTTRRHHGKENTEAFSYHPGRVPTLKKIILVINNHKYICWLRNNSHMQFITGSSWQRCTSYEER